MAMVYLEGEREKAARKGREEDRNGRSVRRGEQRRRKVGGEGRERRGGRRGKTGSTGSTPIYLTM